MIQMSEKVLGFKEKDAEHFKWDESYSKNENGIGGTAPYDPLAPRFPVKPSLGFGLAVPPLGA